MKKLILTAVWGMLCLFAKGQTIEFINNSAGSLIVVGLQYDDGTTVWTAGPVLPVGFGGGMVSFDFTSIPWVGGGTPAPGGVFKNVVFTPADWSNSVPSVPCTTTHSPSLSGCSEYDINTSNPMDASNTSSCIEISSGFVMPVCSTPFSAGTVVSGTFTAGTPTTTVTFY